MLFKPEHKEMILSGKKTATRRIWKRPMAKEGGIYKCKLKMFSKDYFAKIRVTTMFKQCLYNMSDKDAKEEGYENIEDFKKVWIKINGVWNKGLVIDVIRFKLVSQEGEKK